MPLSAVAFSPYARRAIGFADHFVCHVCAALRSRISDLARALQVWVREPRRKCCAGNQAQHALPEDGKRAKGEMAMRSNFKNNSAWIAVVCVIGALLIGAWIGAQVNAAGTTEADWIEAFQSDDAH